jgi:hypothetical protein
MLALNHIEGLYKDSECFRVVMHYGGNFEPFEISEDEYNKVLANTAVRMTEVYEDDPDAFYYTLDTNNAVLFLNSDSQRKIDSWQCEVIPYLNKKEKLPRNPITGHILGGGRGER